MKKTVRFIILLCAATPLLVVNAAENAGSGGAATTTTPTINPSDLFTNSILAKGKGVSVSQSQLDDALIGIKTTAAARGQTIPPAQMTLLEQRILQQLIDLQLLNAKATEADKAAGKELTDKRLAEIKSNAGSEEALDTQLKAAGMTRSELISKMTEELTAQTVLKRELKVSISDEDVKKFYDDNPAKFEKPEMVRAAHVLISTKDMTTGKDLSDEQKAAKKKVAEEVLKKARAGEDFAKLAKEYSDDPGSKDKGGEYTFPRGQMVPEFEAAAFTLKTNQVSDIVTTQFGYHIIKLYEKIPAKKTELDDKTKEDIKEYLTQQEIQKQIPDYTKKLQKEADVQILDASLKPAEMPAAPNTPANLQLK
jgi:parvulin-like peptidyl-prolyl isomerase